MVDIGLIIPETTLLVLACGVLMVDVFRSPNAPGVTFWAAVISSLLVLAQLAFYFPDGSYVAFSGQVKIDAMGAVLKAFVMVLSLLSMFYARDYFDKRGEAASEFLLVSVIRNVGHGCTDFCGKSVHGLSRA